MGMTHEEIGQELAMVKHDVATIQGEFRSHAVAAAETRDDIRQIKDRLADGQAMFTQVKTLIEKAEQAISSVLSLQERQAERITAIETNAAVANAQRAGQGQALKALREWAPVAVAVIVAVVALVSSGHLKP